MKLMQRTIYPEVSVTDDKAGICQYIASDETIDRAQEVIRANGWRFDNMEKNAPFVDSHRYGSLENQVGKVLSGTVEGSRLIETVQWAIDVPENRLANLGWAMTKAGYLKGVSVGVVAAKVLTRLAPDNYSEDWGGATVMNANTRDGKIAWRLQEQETGQDLSKCQTIYLEQQQHELSVCIVGCNPNAVAKSYKAGLLTDSDLEMLSIEYAKRETANSTAEPAVVEKARQRARTVFLMGLEHKIKRL